jgi:hypothetical protein
MVVATRVLSDYGLILVSKAGVAVEGVDSPFGGWRERPSYFWRQAVRPSVDGAADAPTRAELVDP